jgi:Insulinase (Peptidase family M16)
VRQLLIANPQSRNSKELELEIEDMGGHLNAYTSREQTCYHAKVGLSVVPMGPLRCHRFASANTDATPTAVAVDSGVQAGCVQGDQHPVGHHPELAPEGGRDRAGAVRHPAGDAGGALRTRRTAQSLVFFYIRLHTLSCGQSLLWQAGCFGRRDAIVRRKTHPGDAVCLRTCLQVEGIPEEVIFDHLHATAYQNTPLGRTILGPADNIRRLTRGDLADYIGANYTAPRMVGCCPLPPT